MSSDPLFPLGPALGWSDAIMACEITSTLVGSSSTTWIEAGR